MNRHQTSLEAPEPHEIIPQPYSEWNHPYKSWFDVFFSILFSWLYPLSKICQYSPSIISPLKQEDDETKEALVSLIRRSTDMGSLLGLKAGLDRWRRGIGLVAGKNCELVETRLHIHRHVKILVEWNLVDDADDPSSILQNLIATEQEDDFVEVIMRFPLDLLPINSRVRNNEKNKATNCIILMDEESDDDDDDDDNWKLFLPANVPILLYFHGGGFISGSADDGLYMGAIADVLEAQMVNMDSESVPRLIVMSVAYHLAPEHPFPSAHIDTLCVLEYLLSNTTKDHSINLYGVSSGGLLAVSGALAAHQKYPGRLKRYV
jgi:hypothetical protein